MGPTQLAVTRRSATGPLPTGRRSVSTWPRPMRLERTHETQIPSSGRGCTGSFLRKQPGIGFLLDLERRWDNDDHFVTSVVAGFHPGHTVLALTASIGAQGSGSDCTA